MVRFGVFREFAAVMAVLGRFLLRFIADFVKAGPVWPALIVFIVFRAISP